MRPPCNTGMADGEVDISASSLQIKLIFWGTIKETCIFNSNIKVIQAVKSTLSQKWKTFNQGGPHVSTYSSVLGVHVWPTSPYSISKKLCIILEEGIPHKLYGLNFWNLPFLLLLISISVLLVGPRAFEVALNHSAGLVRFVGFYGYCVLLVASWGGVGD